MTPPKIVPAPFVSLGSIAMRMAGSPKSALLVIGSFKFSRIKGFNGPMISIGWRMFVGMIRTTHKRSRFNITETNIQPDLFELIELFGSIKLFDRQVTHGRAQVLSNCHYLAIGGA